MATGSVIFSPFGKGSVLISNGAGFEPEIQFKWQILLVCTWCQGDHVGDQEQNISLLWELVFFHVTSSRKNSFVLTFKVATLSRCCKPRIFFTDFPLSVACEQVLHLEESRRVKQEPHIKGDDSAMGRDRAGAHVCLPVSFASHNSLAMRSLLTGRLHFAYNRVKFRCKKTREGHNLQPIYLFQLRDNTKLCFLITL